MKHVYEELLQSMIEKEAAIEGERALTAAKRVREITIGKRGAVKLRGSGCAAVKALMKEFRSLSPMSIIYMRSAAEAVLKKHPNLEVPEELLSTEARKAKDAFLMKSRAADTLQVRVSNLEK